MEEERMEGKFEIQSSLQTKIYINAYEGKEKWRKIWKKWRQDSRNALCWSFYCVNGNKLSMLSVLNWWDELFVMRVQF